MEIVLIAALDLDGFIGKGGGLPWHLPADLSHFKALTMGYPVIMGRKTCATLPRPLPGRKNIVLTRQAGLSREGFLPASSVGEALELARPASTAMIAGGAEVYAAFLPLATRLELTFVEAHTGGDTKFPNWNPSDWIETAREDRPADTRNPFPMSFRTFVRRR